MLEFNNYYGFLYASCLTQKRLKMTFLYNYFKASQYCKPKPVGTKTHHFKKKSSGDIYSKKSGKIILPVSSEG